MLTRKTLPLAAVAVLSAALGATAAVAAGRARHPRLNRAEAQLRNAKKTLESATHDCGGHRVAAMKLIDQAMSEINAGRDYANAHPAGAKK